LFEKLILVLELLPFEKKHLPAILVAITIFLTPVGGFAKMALWSMDGKSECKG
jgi:hypothetical protein